ncbi:hypothetical protein JCM6882_008910 [Rhodosporidiobolus microsporus]
MPSSTLSLFSAFLAFSSSFLLVAAAPNPAWYLAPTVTSLSAPAAKTTTPSVVWYKADPTTTSKPSLAPSAFSTVWYKAPLPSSSAAPAESTPLPSFSGKVGINGLFWCIPSRFNLCKDPDPPTELDVPSLRWRYMPSEACPNSTLSAEYLAQNPSTFALRGVSLSSGFYDKHGGLERFCGKQLQIVNPLNASDSLTYTVTRGLNWGDERVGLAGPLGLALVSFKLRPQPNMMGDFEFKFV